MGNFSPLEPVDPLQSRRCEKIFTHAYRANRRGPDDPFTTSHYRYDKPCTGSEFVYFDFYLAVWLDVNGHAY
jgi:hypothetical protein